MTDAPEETPTLRGDVGVAALVAAGAVLPWAGVIAGLQLPVPDDMFASDLVDGEWPVRVEAGRRLLEGGPWAWTDGTNLGWPMLPDPWNAVYALLPPVPALGVHWALLLAIATTGGFLLARLHGASRSAAALAAFGFAWSGFFVAQLRHLTIMGVVVWFPLALYLLERAAGARGRDGVEPVAPIDRAGWALAFGFVFGMQILSGFPQSAYYCGLVYASLVAVRAVGIASRGSLSGAFVYASAVGLATAFAAVLGLASVLPMREVADLSDRSEGVSWEFASQCPFYLPDAMGFVVPYATGDIGNGTYEGYAYGIFWEDHGYIGMLAGALIVGWLVGGGMRHFVGRFWAVAGLTAFLIAIGPATPLYRFLWEALPLMDSFRFPTRFLFVVELALVQSAAHGLDELLTARPSARRFAPAIVLLYALDLFAWNRRQLPLADAHRWLHSPTADALADRPAGRVYPRHAAKRHLDAFSAAHGWVDLEPYYAHRASLQPNSNLLDGLSSVNGYVGIAPASVLDLVGGAFGRPGLLQDLDGRPELAAQLLDVLGARYVITDAAWKVEGAVAAEPIGKLVLHDRGPATRVRVVRQVVTLADRDEVRRAMEDGTLDLRVTAVLPPGVPLPPLTAGTSQASLAEDSVDQLVIDVAGDGPGLLVVGDAWYPGWVATVDGVPAEVLRVDIGLRGVPVAAGPHRVELRWTATTARLGVAISSAAAMLAALLGVLLLRYRGILAAGTSATAPTASSPSANGP